MTLAFPADIMRLMPAWDSIPEEFRRHDHSIWNEVFYVWFSPAFGVKPNKEFELKPKPGIDEAKAYRHLGAIMRSFQPKHEHKEASVTYLLSLWFETPIEKEVKDG